MRDVSRNAQAVRNTAIRLLEIAAEMEGRPLPRTAATTRAETCTCDVCGEQVRGLAWIGQRCDSGLLLREGRDVIVKCKGTYRLDPEPTGHKHSRQCYDDAGPGAGGVSLICGLIEGDPEPDLVTLSDGRVLPVTTAQLALSQAAQDFRLAGEAACLLYDGDEDLEAIREGGTS